jgi:hypothetical protein
VTEEAALLAKRAAYAERIRGLYRRERMAGLIACLVGTVALVWSRLRPEAPAWAMWPALGVIALGWVLFAYVIFKRTAWVRAHPFDPNG